MEKKLLLIEYQDNFADNLSIYANAKIMANKKSLNCCYENILKNRDNFEKMMSCFNLKCNYISKNRADEIRKISSKNNKFLFKKNFYINNKEFNFSNLNELTSDILSDINFKNDNFIINHDLLEEIKTNNSIGLYINSKDTPDVEYIQKACRRLNKYLKQPILYIFSSDNIFQNITLDIKYKTIKLSDYKEEFYLLSSCKHKIIHDTDNSRSEGLWASIIKQKDYNYVVYNKRNNAKKIKHNWIKV